MEAGVPKDRLALLAIPMTPLQIVLPLFISKYTAGKRPMDVFIKAMPIRFVTIIPLYGCKMDDDIFYVMIRLVFGLIFAAIVYATPRYFVLSDGSYGLPYYIFLVVVYSIHQVCIFLIFKPTLIFLHMCTFFICRFQYIVCLLL